MAAQTPPWAPQASSISAELTRRATSHGVGGTGVITAADMAVAQTGTPSMAVTVSAGQVLIPGTLGSSTGMPVNANAQTAYGLPSNLTTQGIYYGLNDASVTDAISAANASNPRIDLLVSAARDAQYAGSSNDWVIEVITGTAAGSPVAPAPPANSVVHAQIAVGAAVTSITNSNITDKRPIARGSLIPTPLLEFVGAYGLGPAISGTAPTAPGAVLLHQCGKISPNPTASAGAFSFTFPVAFPNGLESIDVMGTAGSSANVAITMSTGGSTTGASGFIFVGGSALTGSFTALFDAWGF